MKFIYKHLYIFIFILTALYIFSGIFGGKIISNVNHLYNFEPWAHFRPLPPDRGNYIMSDMVDSIGPFVSMNDRFRSFDIPLWDYSHQLGQVGALNMHYGWFNPLRTIFWILLGASYGWTAEILVKFILGGIFLYLFLRELDVNKFISIASAIGFAYGSNNIGSHQAGFSSVSLAAPMMYYYFERLFKTNSWKYVFGLIFSSFYLVSIGFLSVVFYFVYIFVFYAFLKVIFLANNKISLINKGLLSIGILVCLFSSGLFTTIEYFQNGLNLNYRLDLGLLQLNIKSFYNFFIANFFGDPLLEKNRWIYGTYINTGIFIGGLSALIIFTFSLLRFLKVRDFSIVFFFLTGLFLAFNIYKFPFENLEYYTNKLPIFNGNSPTYQKTVFQFVLSIIGALGLDYFWKLSKSNIKFLYLFYFICIFILSLVFINAYDFFNSIGVSEITREYLKKSFFIYSCYLVTLFLIGYRIFISKFLKVKLNYIEFIIGLFLIVLVLWEAKINSKNWISYTNNKYWFPELEITNYLKSNIGSQRIISLDKAAIPEMISGYGIPQAAGRGSVPEAFKTILQDADPNIYSSHPTQSFFSSEKINLTHPVWDLAGVKYFIHSKRNLSKHIRDQIKNNNNLDLISFKEGKLIVRNDNKGMAFLVNDAVVFDSNQDLINLIKDPQFSLDKNILVNREFKRNEFDNNTFDNLKLTDSKIKNYIVKSNKITIDLDIIESCYLIVNNYFFPGWHAKLINSDGTVSYPLVQKAYGFLQSINIEVPGQYKVELTFFPKHLYFSLILTFIGIILLFYIFKLCQNEKN